jgi:hypothetical protein
MEQDINVLKKLLNNKIFLDKFPLIRYVHVNKSITGDNNIEVVFAFKDGFEYNDYRAFKEDARSLVYQLAKYSGVSARRISIYP